jgi:hypothetical protein
MHHANIFWLRDFETFRYEYEKPVTVSAPSTCQLWLEAQRPVGSALVYQQLPKPVTTKQGAYIA